MNVALPKKLTVDAFLAWVQTQPQEVGKCELLDGMVIVQQSQTWGHSKRRMRIYEVLAAALKRQELPFFAAPEGPTVRVSESKAFEPDALVAPLPEPSDDSLEVENPIIVVEVLSPSTARIDATVKLKGYFELSSVQHYLMVDSGSRIITHHRRNLSGAIETVVIDDGVLLLDPPGLTVSLDDIFGSKPSAA